MRVKGGRPQRKNNWSLDPSDYFALPQAEIRIDRRSAGAGRHLITVAQLRAFVDLLPDWDTVAIGLNAIVLDAWEWNTDGWHTPGVVGLCAWDRALWYPVFDDFVEEHRELLDALGVERAATDAEGETELRWTVEQARAYQLLHVLPHELGHHHDRMTTRSKRASARGESYAEGYANKVFGTVLPTYAAHFGL
jgi:hypothetical protein